MLSVESIETSTSRRERRGCVLVAVSGDRASAVALRRGLAFARQLAWDVRLVHVVDDASVSVEDDVRDSLVEWARREAAAEIARRSIAVRRGKAVGEIWREAAALDADLLVLGGVVSGGPGPGWLVRFLAQHARRPVLVASDAHGPTVVAATDLSEAALPVVRCAALFAESAGARLEAVHNVSSEGVEVPKAALSSEALAELDRVDDLRVTRAAAPSDAILRVARDHDVDLVVVGAHETSGRTLRELLLEAQRSVLAVPLRSRFFGRG